MADTPTTRSLKHMREQGYICEKTEHWNHFANRRQDLFDVIDILCVKPNEMVGVQTTSYAAMSARKKKIKESEKAAAWLLSGAKILLHGWRKNKNNRWEVKELDIKN